MKFCLVYIREVHPTARSRIGKSSYDGVSIPQAKTELERTFAAEQMCTELSLDLPTVIDNLQNTTSHDYLAFPDRLYLVGRDGRVAYRGGPGPFAFEPQELDDAIQAELALEKSERPPSPASQVTSKMRKVPGLARSRAS